MSEFDEKLSALLSDPSSMARIMELAQSLGGAPGSGGPGPSPAPSSQPGGSSGGPSPPPNPFPPGTPGGSPAGGTFPDGGGGNPLSALLGGVDPALLAKLLPLAQELGGAQNSQAAALLFALEPYLKPERRVNVPRALQLARLLRLGKRFLRDREGGAFV